MLIKQDIIVTHQNINNLHNKDLSDRRREYLTLRSTLITSIAQIRISYSILLLVWTLIYIQTLTQLGTSLSQFSGRFFISFIIISILGTIFAYLFGRIILYSTLTKSLNNLGYNEINLEIIRELRSHNLIKIAIEKCEELIRISNPNWIKPRIVKYLESSEGYLPTSADLVNYIIVGIVITILHTLGSWIWFI